MSLDIHGNVNSVLVQRVLNHACSHNLQQLTFTFLNGKNVTYPLSQFSSQSLKHLILNGFFGGPDHIIPTSMWELPALTTLHLEHISLHDDNTDKCVGLFSNLTNLKSLTIIGGDIIGLTGFSICHPQLSNITIKYVSLFSDVINVVAPQLKFLTICNSNGKFRISAPDLTTLLYKNLTLKLKVDIDSLPSLEKVELCISHTYNTNARKVVDMLQKFNRVKFLTLSLEVIELLSSSVEVIGRAPSPFVNMRSLRIHPESNESWGRKESMAIEVKKYLLDASPSATFILDTRKDIRVLRNVSLAQNLMAELRVLLDSEKYEEDKGPQLHVEKRGEPRVHSYCEDLIKKIKKGETKICDIKSLVQHIEDILIKLPTSNKAELQPRFSSLCGEVDTLISKILNCINAKSAQNLMAELRELLDLEKNTEDKRLQPCTKMPLDMRKRESRVQRYWEGLDEEIRQGKTKTSNIISLVRQIKHLLIKLPAPDKAESQPCFSSLCVEANNVITEIVNRMKVECVTKGSGLIVNFHELIEAARSSF